jgi:methionyl-tRNA formyltransferase
MKYVFFGTPEFAAIILKQLIDAHLPPATLVCNPDRPVGRKKIIAPPPTKVSAQKSNIAVLQPEKLDADFVRQIRELKPEFAVIAAYAKIIPKSIIDLFPKGVIGVHPSLLPKYRGASPIQSVILGGEKETGVTLYLLDEKMDHGPILTIDTLQLTIDQTYGSLLPKLADLGGRLLVKTLPKFVEGKIKPQPQNELEATFTKKLTTDDAFADEKDLNAALAGDAEKTTEIDRKIRALNPEPGVWTILKGKRTKLLEAKIENGQLVLTKIQEEGGRPKTV